MSNAFRELTPLSDRDCYYIVERHKSEFLYPIHSHREYELNFIENGKGVEGVVGDSIEEIGDLELTLVTGDGLEHAWEQGSCTSADIREINIQFSDNLLDDGLFGKNQFASIKKMLDNARHGVTSQDKNARILASTSFANTKQGSESRRIVKLKRCDNNYFFHYKIRGQQGDKREKVEN